MLSHVKRFLRENIAILAFWSLVGIGFALFVLSVVLSEPSEGKSLSASADLYPPPVSGGPSFGDTDWSRRSATAFRDHGIQEDEKQIVLIINADVAPGLSDLLSSSPEWAFLADEIGYLLLPNQPNLDTYN